MQDTQNKIKYNNYSPQLKAEIEAARPRRGSSGKREVVYFETDKRKKKGNVWVFPNSVSVPNSDVIRDPYTGEYIEIAYLIRPSTGEKGKMVFEGSVGGRIMCAPGALGEALFDYLYLSNYNSDNARKEEQCIRPSGGFLFHRVKPSVTAAENLKKNRRIRAAQNAVDEFPEEVLRTYAYAMNLGGITEFVGEDEIRVKLLEIAGKTPELILEFDKDYDKKLELWAKRLEEKNIIEWGNGKCILGKTQEKLFSFKVGSDRVTELKDFLLEHQEVKELLDSQLEGADMSVK